MSSTIRIGVVTVPNPSSDLSELRDLVSTTTASVLVFPEAYLGNSPTTDDDARWDHALDLHPAGRVEAKLEDIARETGVFMIMGVVEKIETSLFSTVLYIDPNEGILNKRRKIITSKHTPGSAETLQAVTTSVGDTRVNLISIIGHENLCPLIRQAAYAQNINLYTIPTLPLAATQAVLSTIALEGRCFVVCAATSPPKRGRRMSVLDEDGNEIVLACNDKQGQAGCPAFIGPNGVYMETESMGDGSIIGVELDLDECVKAKEQFDEAGAAMRNGQFSFSIQGLEMAPLPL
jgi:nitrilase